MDQTYLKGQCGSNRIVPQYKFIKNISRSKKKLFTKPYWGYLREQHCSDVIISRSEFTENVCKYNTTQTIFDNDWLNWSKWTIPVNPYCPWLFRNIFFKFIKFILKIRFASNHISIESKNFKNLWKNLSWVRSFQSFRSNHIVPIEFF